jgi:phosphoribosyl isomerase A
MSMTFTLFPAIDLKDGRAVRLYQGKMDLATDYGTPLDVAESFLQQGAEWIHLVDLDAATGAGNNQEIVHQIIKRLPISIELSGGIRDQRSLDSALETGATRVNIGTAAITNLSWTQSIVQKYGETIAIALDIDGTKVAMRGWQEKGPDVNEVLTSLMEAGVLRYVVTDISRDGTLTGPNLSLLETLARRTSQPIVASGGISSLDDLEALTQVEGVEGAVIGKALYSGAFTLEDARARIARVKQS